MTKEREKKNKGFVILFAVTISAILLAIALGVSNIALKELNFSTSAKNANDAFLAADTGAECALYYDKASIDRFSSTNSGSSITCGTSTVTPSFSGNATLWSYDFSISNFNSCAYVTISKDNTAPPATVKIVSKGYNAGILPLCTSFSTTRVERQLEISY